MLTDSSLTNILIVSGVSQIRYRAYSQSCSPTQLLDHLKHHTQALTLLKAYDDLTSLSIPALWQVASESNEPGKQLVLELWVFWFDETHTGKIDANNHVDALEEIEVGSFTWENAYSTMSFPSQHNNNSNNSNNNNNNNNSSGGNLSVGPSHSGLPATLTSKHKLFIRSIRNLIRLELKRKGALPLGEFYLFPHTGIDQQDIPSLLSASTMLCCSYNLYLTSTNLVFQPNTRRMQIRPVTLKVIRTKGKKVMMSPSGETAWIAFNPYSPSSPAPLSPQTEDTILHRWASLLDLSPERLRPNASLPALVALKRQMHEDAFYYPTSLLFLSSSNKLSPTAMAGMNGVFGYNQGYSEDLGDRWYRWAWSEQAGNYWDYVCSRDMTTRIVMDTLAQESHVSTVTLQKALNEPVMSSPLMATKSVVTHRPISPHEPFHVKETQDDSDPAVHHWSSSSRMVDQTGLSLVEFAMAHFASPQESEDGVMSTTTDYAVIPPNPSAMTTPYMQSHPHLVMSSPPPPPPPQQSFSMPHHHHQHHSSQPQHQQLSPQQPHLPQQQQQSHLQQQQQQQQQPPQQLVPPPPQQQQQAYLPNQMSGTNTAYQSPQMPNLELGSFDIVENMDVDNMVLDMPNRWTDDGMNDMDNFDFGVTEEDFDFFETSAPPPLQPPMIPPEPSLLMPTTQDMLIDPQQEDTLMLSTNDLDFSFPAEPDNKAQSPIVSPSPQAPPQGIVDSLHLPSQFAPVKFDVMVNDAKYTQGGKFTYTPPNSEPALFNRKNRLSEEYRPDYVPLVRARKKNKNGRRKSSKIILETIHKENKSLTVPAEPMSEAKEQELHKERYHISPFDPATATTTHDHPSHSESNSNSNSSSSSSSSMSDSNSSSSSSSESESEDDMLIKDKTRASDNESTRSETNHEEGPNKLKRIMDALEQAQERYIQQLISLKPLLSRQKSSLRSVDQLVMDYDSPFAQAIASNTIRSSQTNCLTQESDEADRYRALDHLCQQAVMGGYPFSGGIEAMSSNGFEANEGESAKVVIARRRNLLQKLNGDTIHLPSTPHDVDLMIQRFKSVLSDVFQQQVKTKQGDTIDAICLDQLPMPSSVTVKGPLSVQQYYDLSEANQAHSKYGKYQVKKRRPAEPNLDTLKPPTITVNRQEEAFEGSSRLIMFWEKLRLEPYSNKKHVVYFVLYPKNESIESHVTHFFRGLSSLYETCQLGAHHPGTVHTYRRGLVPVSLLAPLHEHESMEDRQLRSYMAECQQLGSSLSSMMNENLHIVIYMINPLSHLGSHLDLSLCFNKLSHAYQTGQMQQTYRKTPARLVLQLMPIEHVLRSTAFGGCLKFGLKEIAFAVYSKCHTVVHRPGNLSMADIYSPPFILSKPVPTQIPFKLKRAIQPFPTVLEDHPVLHMAYSFSFDRKWMVIVWTDSYGELVEFALLDRRQYKQAIFKEAWSRTKQVSRRTGSAWTFVIAKMGLLFEDELKAWMACFQNKAEDEQEKVAIVSLEMESTLHVNATTYLSRLNELSDMMSAATTPTGTSASTGTTNATLKSSLEYGQTKALLLNHRVAYSNRQERMSFGMLNMNPISHIEDWMIPLASGYMIHTPSTTTENPNNELFNCDPVVLEIHLIYNQTHHSAYSTLRDIIKAYHALSYVNVMPSDSNCFPIHLALVERLCRLLLVVHS